MLNIEFAVAKVNKYASRESGDTFELVERPIGAGGLTAVLVDGQGSGRSAKNLSNFVAGHCVSLLKQGVRDSVVARAANDQLYNHKFGQVSATLNLLSADLVSQTLVITRNNPQPVYLAQAGDLTILAEEAVPLGIYPRTRPLLHEVPLRPALTAIVFTDGLSSAGDRYNPTAKPDLTAFLHQRLTRPILSAQSLADELLELALVADHRRPQDDTTVVVFTTTDFEADDGTALPRRLSVQLPFLLKTEEG